MQPLSDQPMTSERNGQSRDIVHVFQGHGAFMQEVPRTSIHAQTRMRIPRRPADNSDAIWINLGCGGIGDSLLGMCAVKGFKRLHQDRDVIYRISEVAAPFVALFDGGYDGISYHVFDEVFGEFPKDSDARDLQMNLGYKKELEDGAQITRLERYCRNLGHVVPEMPTLRDEEALRKIGKQFAGKVVLNPFSTRADRDYPLHGWLTVERALVKAGYKVVVVARADPNRETPTHQFGCEVVLNLDPKMLAGMMLTAAVVVSNDSGPAHLAGMLGTPTVVLCGWSVGDRIYGFYPTVRSLQGVMGCNGCWTMGKDFDKVKCMLMCANLASINPGLVLREVATRVYRHVD